MACTGLRFFRRLLFLTSLKMRTKMHYKKDFNNSKTDLLSDRITHMTLDRISDLLSNWISHRSAVGMDIGSDVRLELSQANETGQMWYLRNHKHITPSSRGYMLGLYPFVS